MRTYLAIAAIVAMIITLPLRNRQTVTLTRLP
jgi:hypothetical protein